MSPVAVWLLTVCLCRRFMDQEGQSSLVSLSKERAQLQPPTLKPSPPKTTALLHKQGPCCVCERTPDTQPLMERIRPGLHNFDTLFQAAQYWRLSVRSQRTARNQDLLSEVPPGRGCTEATDQYLFADRCRFWFLFSWMQEESKCNKCFSFWSFEFVKVI